MNSTLLILPNQLFKAHPGLKFNPAKVVLLEDTLFFKDAEYPLNFHKQKLIFHRASMKAYGDYLSKRGYKTQYIDWHGEILSNTFKQLKSTHLIIMDPVDQVIEQRIINACNQYGKSVKWLDSRLFLNTPDDNETYFKTSKHWYMAQFYQFQRKRLNLLMNGNKPTGGKWSFDTDNRKKIPLKNRSLIPALPLTKANQFTEEAKVYVNNRFPNALGNDDTFYYPVTFNDSQLWLQQFLCQRFEFFGIYQDALVPEQSWLYHSILSPLINSGLLTTDSVIAASIEHADNHNVPIASLEGFIRQIIGWREFIRASYCDLGVQMRTSNHWQHTNTLPDCFYHGDTDISPVDDVIGRLLKTGYCNHIERLMVLGGFMFLCEIRPDDIYSWFMEMFIDAYDWVMVPNIYAMSQNADGGLITTKPYFSGSAYIKKMGYHIEGEWQQIWDGLYWRWISKNKTQLRKNPRWAMMCKMAEEMDSMKLNTHLQYAETYLDKFIRSK